MAEVKVDSLKPNSHTYKRQESDNEKRKLEPIVKKDSIVSTKKPVGKRIAENFIKEDVKDIKNYILMDVIIPGIKNVVLDMLSMAFFGETRSRDRSRRDDRGYYSYSSRYRSSSSSSSSRDRDRRYDNDDKTDYRNIVLRERDDAEEIINQLCYRIRETGKATIGDLFDLLDIAGRYVDNDWGWTSERDIGIRRVSSGYLIDVAEARYVGRD